MSRTGFFPIAFSESLRLVREGSALKNYPLRAVWVNAK